MNNQAVIPQDYGDSPAILKFDHDDYFPGIMKLGDDESHNFESNSDFASGTFDSRLGTQDKFLISKESN